MNHEQVDYEHYRFLAPGIYVYKRSNFGFRVNLEMPCDYDGHYCQRKLRIQVGRWTLTFLLGV